jgi:hypothetical protein
MTEAEYIDYIKSRAEAYISKLKSGAEMSAGDCETWFNVKANLSPYTLLDLCETWLGKNKEAEEA